MLKRSLLMIVISGSTGLSLMAMDNTKATYTASKRQYSYGCPGKKGQNLSALDKAVLNKVAQCARGYVIANNIAENALPVGIGAGIVSSIVLMIRPFKTFFSSIHRDMSLQDHWMHVSTLQGKALLISLGALGITFGTTLAWKYLGNMFAQKRLMSQQKACKSFYQEQQAKPTSEERAAQLIGSLYVPRLHLHNLASVPPQRKPLAKLLETTEFIRSVIEEPVGSKVQQLGFSSSKLFRSTFMKTVGAIEGHSECLPEVHRRRENIKFLASISLWS